MNTHSGTTFRRLGIVLLALGILLLPTGRSAVQADGLVGVTGGFHFTAAAFGMEGWMRYDVHATGDGELATGWVRWQEYNAIDGWRRVVSHPTCVVFGQSGGAPAAAIVVQIDSRTGWGEGDPGQYVMLWVKDGGTPGWNGDQFTTLTWPPQDEPLACAYSDASFIFAEIDAGDLMIHP